MVEGGADAVLVETAQDLLQVKAAVVGARRAMAATGQSVVLIAQVTVELTGTMLLGSEIGAALAALEPLGIDVIGMNCATGPAEMSEHLRFLSRHATVPLSVMPNAGLPVLGRSGPEYPLQPSSWPTRSRSSCGRTASGWWAGAAAPRPSTCARWSSGSVGPRSRCGRRSSSRRPPRSTRRSRSVRTPAC
jgi:5-methyltetrahydrofolate--homocysteine methyltransferase